MADPAVRPPQSKRDLRLDVFRGLALVTIFIDHVPPNAYEHLTLRNWGFSDAAEAFVLMSGISAGLAYGPAFREPGADRVRGLGRVWGRAWTLYLVQMVITIAGLAVAAGFARFLAAPELLGKHGMGVLFEDPTGFLVGVPLLTHQLGYLNILPTYIILLAVAPAMVLLALRSPAALLLVSGLVWLLMGHVEANFPAYPGGAGWFLNPLTWQILFAVGIPVGLAMREKRGQPAQLRWLRWAGVGFLALALLWREWGALGAAGNHYLWILNQHGLSGQFTSFSKPNLAAPRLLHVLALLAVVAGFPVFKRLTEARWATPLALLGRQALPVFAFGSVLAYAGQGIKTITGESFLLDTMILAIGLAAMWALALAKDSWPKAARRPAPAPAPERQEGPTTRTPQDTPAPFARAAE